MVSYSIAAVWSAVSSNVATTGQAEVTVTGGSFGYASNYGVVVSLGGTLAEECDWQDEQSKSAACLLFEEAATAAIPMSACGLAT